MTLNKNDFIEIDFVGKIKDTGAVFDSNIKDVLQKLNPENKNLEAQAKKFSFALGHGMFINGVDEFLVGKNEGKHLIELSPEKAFGKRDLKLIQIIPLNLFRTHNQNPIPGMIFNLDNRLAKILSVNGGRVSVDFNHPLAGKEIIYEVEVKRKLSDLNEKANSLVEFLFRQPLKFEIKDKKLFLEIQKELKPFAELFKDKFKELLELELEFKEIENKK